MIFSQRYHRAIESKKIIVYLPEKVIPKIFTCLDSFDTSIGVQRDRYDSFISNSSVFEETILELIREHGWDGEPGQFMPDDNNFRNIARFIVKNYAHEIIFDFIEIMLKHIDKLFYDECRKKVNNILDLHDCPWRISDGHFFKIDPEFMGERLAATAHDALTANKFAGAAHEYAKARQELAAGDVKVSILHSAKSFESVLKVITGEGNINADQLIKSMIKQNYFDDLPEDVRDGFGATIMRALPFLRNKLAGHGQGANVVEIPIVYGELALQIAAAMHNLLISKHLERNPLICLNETPSSLSDEADDIPF